MEEKLEFLVREFIDKSSEPIGFKEIQENFKEVSEADLLVEINKLSNAGKM